VQSAAEHPVLSKISHISSRPFRSASATEGLVTLATLLRRRRDHLSFCLVPRGPASTRSLILCLRLPPLTLTRLKNSRASGMSPARSRDRRGNLPSEHQGSSPSPALRSAEGSSSSPSASARHWRRRHIDLACILGRAAMLLDVGQRACWCCACAHAPREPCALGDLDRAAAGTPVMSA